MILLLIHQDPMLSAIVHAGDSKSVVSTLTNTSQTGIHGIQQQKKQKPLNFTRKQQKYDHKHTFSLKTFNLFVNWAYKSHGISFFL